MGVLNNTAASITVTSGTNLGTISVAPTISYTVRDTNPGGSFGVDHYLDRTTLWFGAIQFVVDSYESSVTRTNTFTISSGTWADIYDGPHTIILRTSNGTGLHSQAIISFTRTGNPKPQSSGSSLPPTTINPINPPVNHPTFSDNEVVKMGILRHIHKEQGQETVKYIKQKLCNPGTMVEVKPRLRNGFLLPGYYPNEQITFVDTNNDSEKWEWVKTTLPNNKTIFISTTYGPEWYLHPLSEINVTLQGQNYILRNLTKSEWFNIDKSILEKISFGTYSAIVASTGSITTHDCSVVTRTSSENSNDNYYDFLKEYNDSQYNSWISNESNYRNKEFVTLKYSSQYKKMIVVDAVGGLEGEGFPSIGWIPVLELKNTDPIIDLPDKRNSDPTVNI